MGVDLGGRKPVFDNRNEAVAAWLNMSEGGDAYLSVSLPLGLGDVSVFPANDEVQDALNQLYAHLDKKGVV